MRYQCIPVSGSRIKGLAVLRVCKNVEQQELTLLVGTQMNQPLWETV